MKTLLEIIAIVIAFSLVFTLVTSQKVFNKATAFCDKEVVVGEPSAALLAKVKKIKKERVVSSISSPDLMWVAFMGGYRPVFCYVTVKNGVITAKHIEIDD